MWMLKKKNVRSLLEFREEEKEEEIVCNKLMWSPTWLIACIFLLCQKIYILKIRNI